MHRSSSIPPHRQSRRAQRRQKMRRLALVAVVSLITMWAFGAGYLWRQLRAKSETAETTSEQVIPQERAQALELLDLAVTARHGELTNEAVRLALDARRVDPTVPGAALFLAEMSLRAGDAEGVNAAAKEALAQEIYAADARLLLALNAWMLRGQTGTEDAGRSSSHLLAEASEAELANNQVRFFAGDVLRAIGRPGEAHSSLIGSLHRQGPWDSTSLLAAKLWLALEEAGPKAQSAAALATGREGENCGATAVQLQRAIREQSDTAQFASALQSVFTAKQIAELSFDPALAGVAGALARPVGEQLSLPFARANPSNEEVGALPREAWQQETNALDTSHFQLPDGLLKKE